MSDVKRKCYISYKFEDEKYKEKIIEKYADVIFIDKSQKIEINSDNPDKIMNEIRDKYLKDSTVTIFLIGTKSFDDYRDKEDIKLGFDSQVIIRREITSSLFQNKMGNKRSGLLGVVLPEMENKIFGETYECENCGAKVTTININNSTVIKEFGKNYYLVKNKCGHYDEDGRYAVLVKYSEFMNDPGFYIEKAYQKREKPIADKVRTKNFD